MAKGIIVVDVPENCRVCDFYYPAREGHSGKFLGACRLVGAVRIENSKEKPDWCPIRPMPEKKERKGDLSNADKILKESLFAGWNACIDEILSPNERS